MKYAFFLALFTVVTAAHADECSPPVVRHVREGCPAGTFSTMVEVQNPCACKMEVVVPIKGNKGILYYSLAGHETKTQPARLCDWSEEETEAPRVQSTDCSGTPSAPAPKPTAASVEQPKPKKAVPDFKSQLNAVNASGGGANSDISEMDARINGDNETNAELEREDQARRQLARDQEIQRQRQAQIAAQIAAENQARSLFYAQQAFAYQRMIQQQYYNSSRYVPNYRVPAPRVTAPISNYRPAPLMPAPQPNYQNNIGHGPAACYGCTSK